MRLSGAAFKTWIDRWQDIKKTLDDGSFLHALAQTTFSEGYSWCDVCRVFAMHSDLVPATVRSLEEAGRFDLLFAACTTPPIGGYLGRAPPTTDLRQLTTACQVCPEGQIAAGATCQPNIVVHEPPCAPTEVLAVNLCIPCGPGSFAFENQCRSCPENQFLDGVRDECVDECPGGVFEPIPVCVPVVR